MSVVHVQAARQSNPSMRVIRAEDGRIVGTDDFEQIMAADAFMSPGMVAMRALYNPGWTTQPSTGGGGGGQ